MFTFFPFIFLLFISINIKWLIVLIFLILSEIKVNGVAVILINFTCYIVALLNVGFGVKKKSEDGVFYSFFFVLNFFLNLTGRS